MPGKLCLIAIFIFFIMHLYFQVHLFIPCSLATRNKVMLVSEKRGLPPGTLNPYAEWPCGRWVYESPKHLQPGLRSFMNNLGHTCSLPPTVSGSPGTHQVLCTAPSSEDTAPHVVLSLKNAWFPLLSHSPLLSLCHFSPSSLFPFTLEETSFVVST